MTKENKKKAMGEFLGWLFVGIFNVGLLYIFFPPIFEVITTTGLTIIGFLLIPIGYIAINKALLVLGRKLV